MKKFAADGLKRLIIVLAIFLPLLAAGCFNVATSKPVKPSLEENTIEREPESMAVDVVDFGWNYFNDGYHLRVQGVARNNTGEPIQAVTIICLLYDEAGRPVGRGEAFLAPTYLADGAEGTFEIVTMPSRTKGIQYIRLVTRAYIRK